jgi:hypothetical protein
MSFVSVLALSLALQGPPSKSPDEVPPGTTAPSLTSRVNRAIARGVARLKGVQRADGGWDGPDGEHPGGMTALCAFTLAKSGVRRGDDAIQKALKLVLATEFKSVYSHSVRLMLLESLTQPDARRERARESLDFLVASQVGGEWAYPWGDPDASNVQFALLGLRAASRLGLEVPRGTLADAAEALFRLQIRDTGFAYKFDGRPTGGMTAATLAGACVLRELGAGRKDVQGVLDRHRKDLERAREWLVERWDPSRNPSGSRAWTPSWQYPYLWAIERYGGLSGQAKLGERDWYADGAEWLVGEQDAEGGWGPTESTCFALLFLRRATVTSGDAPGAEAAELDAPRKEPPILPAGDLPRIVDWLVAGPWIADDPDDSLVEPPFDPRKVQAKLGDKLARREWRRVALKDDGWTNLDEATGVDGDGGIFAAATTLVWTRDEPLEATLWLDLEDGWDVYLDGARVSTSTRVAAPIDGNVAVPLSLAKGEHRLLCLIEDVRGSSAAFGARISARDGRKLDEAPEIRAVPPKANAK